MVNIDQCPDAVEVLAAVDVLKNYAPPMKGKVLSKVKDSQKSSVKQEEATNPEQKSLITDQDTQDAHKRTDEYLIRSNERKRIQREIKQGRFPTPPENEIAKQEYAIFQTALKEYYERNG